MMINNESEKLRLLAQCWNNLDTRIIESHLGENMIYDSQWARMSIIGEQPFLSYLHSKFVAIKAFQEVELMKVLAESATMPLLNNRGAILLSQLTKNYIRIVTILIVVEVDKITHIQTFNAPDLAELSLSDETPI